VIVPTPTIAPGTSGGSFDSLESGLRTQGDFEHAHAAFDQRLGERRRLPRILDDDYRDHRAKAQEFVDGHCGASAPVASGE
jgi:hypothetical protein